MEYIYDRINNNIVRIVEYLDYNSYENLIESEKINNKKMEIIREVNNYMMNKKDSKLYEYKKRYYERYMIGYDKLEIAWKNNNEYWRLIENENENYRRECNKDKYYRLNYVWWFDVNYVFKNIRGKYRFKLKMNKGNLEMINYRITKNNGIMEEENIDLKNVEDYKNMEIITRYIDVKKDDEINVRFYETNTLKNDIEIYGIEYV